MKPATIRFLATASILALAIVCLTVLAALGVVDAGRVLDIIAAAVPAFCGGLLGARNGNGTSSRAPVAAPYPSERP